jgi:hypothetical protein
LRAIELIDQSLISPLGLGCVKTLCCVEAIEWNFVRIAIASWRLASVVNLIDLRKTILLNFEIAGFSHSQGHGLKGPPRANVVRSTSVSGNACPATRANTCHGWRDRMRAQLRRSSNFD